MTDNEYILSLYDRLTVRGSKGKAIRDIAKMFDLKANSVKQNWLSTREFPEHSHPLVIEYLEEAVNENQKQLQDA